MCVCIDDACTHAQTAVRTRMLCVHMMMHAHAYVSGHVSVLQTLRGWHFHVSFALFQVVVGASRTTSVTEWHRRRCGAASSCWRLRSRVYGARAGTLHATTWCRCNL